MFQCSPLTSGYFAKILCGVFGINTEYVRSPWCSDLFSTLVIPSRVRIVLAICKVQLEYFGNTAFGDPTFTMLQSFPCGTNLLPSPRAHGTTRRNSCSMTDREVAIRGGIDDARYQCHFGSCLDSLVLPDSILLHVRIWYHGSEIAEAKRPLY